MNTIDFTREEFACKCGCGFDAVDTDLLEVLIDLRNHFNSPVYINSGCRCLMHNRIIGGEDTSQHVRGKAADVRVRRFTPEQVYDYLTSKYPSRFGIGLYGLFVHVDSRSVKARW